MGQRRRLHAWAILGLFIISAVFFTFKVEAATPVEAFARLPVFDDTAISPDGKYLALKTNIEGRYYLQIFQINGKKLERTYISDTSDLDVRWIEWASPTRLLVSLGKAYRRAGVPVTETRLFAINYDGTKMKDMIKQEKGDIQLQVQDRVVDFLWDDPNHVIMTYNEDNVSQPRAMLVNINTGKGTNIQRGKEDIFNWVADRQGRIRLGYGKKGENWHAIIREHDNDNWRTLVSNSYSSDRSYIIFGFDRDPNILYVGSNHEGGTTAVYKYDVKAGRYSERVFRHPDVDVRSVIWNKQTWTPRRVEFIADRSQYAWWEPSAEARFKELQKSLPGLKIRLVDYSIDDNVWLIYAGNTNKPGAYYLYNHGLRSLIPLGPQYPELEGVPLGNTFAFGFTARDGLAIPAFLSLPAKFKDPTSAKNLPMVIIPYGGPNNRDFLTFDPTRQMLTARGYAVLQVIFRGSRGYGANFKSAGYGEWGGKMQDDVTDGVNYLIGQGIADRSRICIFGGSYGGYAALMGAVKTPDLYRCAVGLNGLYNPRQMMGGEYKFVGKRDFAYWEAVIGDYGDQDLFKRISPEARAAEIKIPVLLAAADDDRMIRARQTKSMADELKRNKKTVEYLELESGGHNLTTSESRIPFFKALDDFLAKHLK